VSSVPPADQTVRERIAQVMRDFAPEWPEEKVPRPFGGSRSLTFVELPMPRLVQWVLAECLGSKDGGRCEKTAWVYWFTFQGRPFNLALTKFGLRLAGSADSEAEFIDLGDQVVKRLDAAARLAERLVFQSFAETQIAAGSVTILNDSRRLREMYEYFRETAERGLSDEEVRDLEQGDGFVRLFVRDEHRFRYSVALVGAYFSWLEHVLVLYWPFCGYGPGTDDLQRFIGDHWSDKFKRLFDVAHDPEAKRHYDALREVAEEYRNTFAHGGFGRNRRGILVHVPGGAPIEAGLSEIRNRPHFEFAPVPEETLSEIARVLDAADEWMRSGPASFGVKWVEAGFDVPFDSKSVSENVTAMDNGADAFREIMERWSYFANQAANMDW
jgi:hypothetical protein